ncbi:MAG TPA: 3-oxoacyl-ACP reductase FabG [Nannocystaceae bacterium]|nr:3-oxoacyl-ACP reductase FabG [Nannocystaceae bacterium]
MAEPSPRSLPAALDLSGRAALVTGAARGIGKAIAEVLAARGAALAINDRDEAGARELCEQLGKQGTKAIVVGFDVSDEKAVDDGIKRTVDGLGALDILVNNAGISIDSLIMRARVEDFDLVSQVNLRGVFLCCKAATRHLLKSRDKGRIVNLSSVVGEQGNTGQSMYAATKAGVIGITKSLARELASRGVTVNAVAPGFIETALTEEILDTSELVKAIPARRVGTPEEVAACIRFLASEEASYVTGTTLTVDGGLSA